jgi:hypothetical protein
MKVSEIIYEVTLNEAPATNIAVFYGGRFQPMHDGHFQLYNQLTSRFGADNVFIATMLAGGADKDKNPFTFDEKAQLMNKMFGIPVDHVIDTQPYKPELDKVGRDPANTALVLAFSDKDAGRLRETETLRKLPDDLKGLESAETPRVYFVTMPTNNAGMSATDFRDAIKNPQLSDEDKIKKFTEFFGKFDPEVYKFIQQRLT